VSGENNLKMALSPKMEIRHLNLLDFPAAALEKHDAGGGDGGLRDHDGPKDATRLHVERDRQEPGQGNFQEPETEEMHDSRRDGVARAIEGLEHDHAIGVADVAIAENAQAGDGQRNDERIAGKETDDLFGKNDEENADDSKEDHVVKAGAPDGSFRALRLLGAEVLADEGCGGVAEAPTGHQHEDEDANGDSVAGKGRGAEDADDADEADPTGVSDGELQDAGERDTQEAKQDAKVETNLAAQDADAFCAAQEAIELVEHADAAAGEGCESRSGDAQFREGAPAEDKARVEDEVDDVGDPQQAHGDGGVTRAAEDGVVEKEHHDRSAAAEGDAGIAGANGNDLRGGTHQAKQVRPIKKARNADDGRDRESNGDGLNAGNGRAGWIFFADAAGDHSRGRKAKAEANGHDEAEQRFGEANGSDGVRAKAADPENVDDGEKGFQNHFHNHGNGEEENRAIEIASCEVLVRATKGFAHGAPERRLGSGDSGLFQRHIDLYVLRGRFPECRCADAAAAISVSESRRKIRFALAAD